MCLALTMDDLHFCLKKVGAVAHVLIGRSPVHLDQKSLSIASRKDRSRLDEESIIPSLACHRGPCRKASSGQSQCHQQVLNIHMFMGGDCKLHCNSTSCMTEIDHCRQNGGKDFMRSLYQEHMSCRLAMCVNGSGSHDLNDRWHCWIQHILPRLADLSFPLRIVLVKTDCSGPSACPEILVVLIDEPCLLQD